MNINRLARLLVAITIFVSASWLAATNPSHSQVSQHHPLAWYAIAGILSATLCYSLLAISPAINQIKKEFINFYYWFVPSATLFLVAVLMERDANAPNWQSGILIIYFTSAVIGILCSTYCIIALIRKGLLKGSQKHD